MRANAWLRTWRLAVAVVACSIASATQAAAAESLLGKAPDFELLDVAGKRHASGEWTEAKAVVVMFLGTECPLAKIYAGRVNQLAATYGPRGVRFVAIDANVQDTAEEIAAFVRDNELQFPVLVDPGNTVADRFGAVRTPEVFLIDGNRMVRYHGRVDDQYGVGVQRSEPTRRDLVEALDELLAGKDVSQAELPVAGCFIGRATKPTASDIIYSKHVARIFQQHCVECHRPGEIGPFPLTSYQETVGWGETIREVVSEGRMPPWFADPRHGKFFNDCRLSDEQKRQIGQWVAGGCPEGDPHDLPEPRQFVNGWNIAEPNLVLKMAQEPYHVPPEGVIDYQNFVIDPKFTEDKWIVASEARPGNRAVVHHILVFLKTPDDKDDILRGSLLAAYAPGSPPRTAHTKGLAKKIPAGSKIVMQIHYTPTGKAQDDLSSFGLVFCDAKEVTQVVESGWALNILFEIPPGAKDYKVLSQHRFADDRLLLAMTPHMHVRGKSFRYEAIYPDKRREILLDVPRWDFNWQIDYELAEPKLMPKGTVIRCEAHYDNSADNPSNPDPKRAVRFGEQTWDEMMIGWFVACTLPADTKTAQTKTSGP